MYHPSLEHHQKWQYSLTNCPIFNLKPLLESSECRLWHQCVRIYPLQHMPAHILDRLWYFLSWLSSFWVELDIWVTLQCDSNDLAHIQASFGFLFIFCFVYFILPPCKITEKQLFWSQSPQPWPEICLFLAFSLHNYFWPLSLLSLTRKMLCWRQYLTYP